MTKTSPGRGFREISEGKPDLAIVAPPPQKFPDDFVSEHLPTLWLVHSLPHRKTGHLCFSLPCQEQCLWFPLLYSTSVNHWCPSIQAPSRQLEDFRNTSAISPRPLTVLWKKPKYSTWPATPPPTTSFTLQNNQR